MQRRLTWGLPGPLSRSRLASAFTQSNTGGCLALTSPPVQENASLAAEATKKRQAKKRMSNEEPQPRIVCTHATFTTRRVPASSLNFLLLLQPSPFLFGVGRARLLRL